MEEGRNKIMKKRANIYLLIIFGILIIIVSVQGISNTKLKKARGELYYTNIKYLKYDLETCHEYLFKEELWNKNLFERYFWKFNDVVAYACNLPPNSFIGDYILYISRSFEELSNTFEEKPRKDSTEKAKTQLVRSIAFLEHTIDSALIEYGENYLEYYKLNDKNSDISKKFNDALFKYYNENIYVKSLN